MDPIFPSYQLNEKITVETLPIPFLKDKLSNISATQREAYMALSHHATNKESVDQFTDDKIFSIFQTNAISTNPGEVGIFPLTARMNHACVSAFNTVFNWREEEGVLGLPFSLCLFFSFSLTRD
jgi:hypothetical protein